MAYWIFKYNPKVYQLAEQFGEANPVIDWRVPQHSNRIRAGDIAFLWQTGPNRGITAIMQVDQPAEHVAMFDREDVYFVDPDSHEAERIARTQRRVIGKLTRRALNLPMARLRTVPGLENLSAFAPRQETVFPVTEEEGTILEQLAENGTV